MRQGLHTQGYTVVEVMIFLAVSGALLVSALLMVGGQQRKTQFSQSIRDMDSKIRDIINDVSTGLYNNSGNFRCAADNLGGAPLITSGAASQGTNAGCTFIGRVMQFGPSGANDAYRVYSVVGRQYTGGILSSQQVQNLFQAKPIPIAPSRTSTSRPDATESSVTNYGLAISSITYDNGSGAQPIGAFGFFSSFANYPSGSSNAESSKQFTDMWVIPGSSLGQHPWDLAENIIAMGGLSTATAATYKAPQNGITLCFLSGGNQYGKIVIGRNQQSLTTQLTIGNGNVCS